MINVAFEGPVSEGTTDDKSGSLGTPSTSSTTIGSAEVSDPSVRYREGSGKGQYQLNGLRSDENIDDDISLKDVEEYWINKKAFLVNKKIKSFLKRHSKVLKYLAIAIALALYCCYFGYAIYYSPKGAVPLIVGTVLVASLVIINAIFTKTKDARHRLMEKWQNTRGPKYMNYASLVLMVILVIGITIFVCYDARHHPSNLISLAGLVVFLLLGFIISTARTKVRWRTVVASLLVQFLFGFLIVRWNKGLIAFEWMATQVSNFLFFTNHGSKFVFGELYTQHEFIMLAMPVVIYFGAWIGLLYHWGILQKVIMTFGFFIQFVIGVGPLEAFVSAASIFLDPQASAMTISSFLPEMTLSELHCIMTSGFSTVAGNLYGVYLSAGISASSLMAASVLSAPAGLGMSKLIYPEKEKSAVAQASSIVFPKLECKTSLEAFAHGAKEGFFIIVQVVVNLVAAVALLAFIDSTLMWFGARVGIMGLTFAKITSYLFYPVAFIMGVDTPDCLEVARLLGTKLFLTEIVGYQELGVLIKNREMGLLPSVSKRSETIATFALCGFSSFPDVAILVSALSALAPTRKGDIASIALRAMFTGNMSCYLSACVAGLLFRY